MGAQGSERKDLGVVEHTFSHIQMTLEVEALTVCCEPLQRVRARRVAQSM